jgi:uncharacterized protein (DUF697 family)
MARTTVPMPDPNDEPRDWLDRLVQRLLEVIANVPATSEPLSQTPDMRCRFIVRTASIKAAGLAGVLALPPGPFGIITILPDLIAIWRLQAQMVADIAAAYGRTSFLSQESMLYCLFRHAASQAMRDIIVRVGERYLIRRGSLRVIQQVLRRVGVKATQRLVSRTISRWVPIVGGGVVAAYAYFDTTRVGSTAIELFSREIDLKNSDA